MLTDNIVVDALSRVPAEWLVMGPLVAGVVVDKVRQLWINSPAYRRFNQKRNAPTIDLRNVASRAEPIAGAMVGRASSQASSAASSATSSAVSGAKTAGKAAVTPSPEGGGKKKKEKPAKDTSLNDFRVQFATAVNRLRTKTGDRERLYDYPWYLMIGEEGSGKSTLMTSSTLAPWHREDELTKPGERFCGWWSSEHAVILDIEGSLIHAQSGKTKDAAWRLVMSMLQKHRYRRPIDGIILTIPATDLIGPTKLDDEAIARKGEILHRRMKDIEERLGMCVPIYPVVTKCDLVAGFSSFCAWLPQARRDDIFGWSNPYTIETAYTPEWVDEAFRDLWETLSPAQMDMLAELPHGADGDGLFQFPSELHSLKAGVRGYLDALMRPGAHTHVALMLRGIFFTGDGNVTPTETGPITVPGEIISGPAAPDIFAEPIAAAGEPIAFAGAGPSAEAPTIVPTARGVQPVFVKQLFDRKVLTEYAVAYPFTRNLLSKNRLILTIQVACAVIILGALVGMPLETGRLADNARAVLRDLRTVDDNLEQVRRGAESVTDMQYVEYAQNLLDGIARIENTSLRSWAYPSSWLSPLHGEIRGAMVVAFDSVILKAMNVQLDRRAEILPVDYFTVDPIDSTSAALAIEATPEYIQLRRYVDELRKLERHAIMYNRMQKDEQIENVDTLVRYLFEKSLPEGFIKKASYSSRILSEVSPEPFEFEAHRAKTTQTAAYLLNRLNDRLFSYNPLLLGVRRIINNVETLASQQGKGGFTSVEMMFDIGTTIDRVKTAMQQKTLDWLGSDEFSPTGELARLLRDIETSRFIDRGLARTFTNDAGERFKLLRSNLSDERSEIIGNVVVITNAKKNALRLTPAVDSLHAAIVQLGRQKFMQTRVEERVRSIGGPGKVVFWSVGALEEAKKLPDLFRTYSGEAMTKFPRGLQTAAQNVALAGLETSMAAFVNRAQRSEGNGRSLEDVRRQTQNLKSASAQFIDLLQFYDSYSLASAVSLRSALQVQGNSALSQVDALLRSDNLYRLVVPAQWRGEAGLGDLMFGDPGTLAAQLGEWKEKLKQYTAEYADPLIAFLNSVDAGVASGTIENWRNIVSEVNGGGPSIKGLEAFFMGLNDITIYNYSQKLPDPKTLPASPLLRQLRREAIMDLWSACFAILLNRANESYAELRDDFNNSHVIYFPWSSSADPNQPMVTEDQARLFAKRYSADRARFWPVWSHYSDTDPITSKRREYLTTQFDGIAPFLSTVFGGPETEPAGADILVTFNDLTKSDGRVRTVEAHRQIADWTLRIGNQVATMQDYAINRRPIKLRWNFSDDIFLTVRFAQGGCARPATIEFPQGNAPVRGRAFHNEHERTTTVEYRGPWALAQLLRNPEFVTSDRRHLVTFKLPMVQVMPADQFGGDFECPPQDPSMNVNLGIVVLGTGGVDRIQVPKFPEGLWPK